MTATDQETGTTTNHDPIEHLDFTPPCELEQVHISTGIPPAEFIVWWLKPAPCGCVRVAPLLVCRVCRDLLCGPRHHPIQCGACGAVFCVHQLTLRAVPL